MFIRNSSQATSPNLPQASSSSSTWDPSTISNVIFGISMICIGLIAIWQGYRRPLVGIDEEMVFIRPARTITASSMTASQNTADAIELGHTRRLINAAPPAPLPIENNEEIETAPSVTENAQTTYSSNRVTTLSTVGSNEG